MNSVLAPYPPTPTPEPLGAARVTVTIVTYADRRALLRQVLDAVSGQGVGKVVVVDNGGRWPVKDELTVAL